MHQKKKVNASKDVLEVVVNGHILAAVISYLGMSSLHDKPSSSIVLHDIWIKDDDTRRKILKATAQHVVSEHVDLATVFLPWDSKDEVTASSGGTNVGSAYEYACKVLTLGLFISDFKDAVHEDDSNHMLVIWKYLILLFRATGRKNYEIEALTLLSQYHITLPCNLAEQLKWSRFVNVHGLPGTNISSDLHIEPLNKLVKVSIEGLGASPKRLCKEWQWQWVCSARLPGHLI